MDLSCTRDLVDGPAVGATSAPRTLEETLMRRHNYRRAGRGLLRSVRFQIAAIFTALAALGGFAFVMAGASTASTTVCPGGVPGALVCISPSAARGWYIDPNGGPHLLPMGPNAIYGQSGDYPHDWFKGGSLDVTIPATPATTSTPTSKPLAGETAPVLTLADNTVSSITLQWSAATAPSAKTINYYTIEWRKHDGSATFPSTASTTNADVFDAVVTSVVLPNTSTPTALQANTEYDFQVNAVYTDKTSGPFSNILTATTTAS